MHDLGKPQKVIFLMAVPLRGGLKGQCRYFDQGVQK